MIEAVSLALGALQNIAGPASARAPDMGAAGSVGASGQGVSGQGFADMLAGIAREGVASLHAAETVSVNGIAGKAGVQEVVNAMLTAERNLQTAIAIRDKTISAIQEITRMQM